MRLYYILAALALGAPALLRVGSVPDRAPGNRATPPNIVVVMTDDQRCDQGTPIMPLLRKSIGDSGVTFRHCLHTGTVCCASRAIFYSGQAQHNNGVVDNYGAKSGAPAFDHTSSVAVELQQSGYVTGIIGKYMNDLEAMGPLWTAPGWDEWRVFKEGNARSPFVARYRDYTLTERALGAKVVVDSAYGSAPTDYSTSVIRRKALDFLDRAPRNRPVFLVLTPYAPHTAVDILDEDAGRCDAYNFPESPSSNERDVSDKPAWLQAKPLLTPRQVAGSARNRRRQCEALQAVDRMVFDVVDKLRSTGRLENTLFVYTSDNGFLWNEHRLRNRKHVAYLEGITVPLVIRGPGVARGVVDTSLVHIADLPATFRELAGLPPGRLQHGRSLVPLLAKPNQRWTDELLIEHEVISSHPEERFTGIRTRRWYYIESPAGGPNGTPFVELYDLRTDPWQMKNIASEPSARSQVTLMKERLALRRQSR